MNDSRLMAIKSLCDNGIAPRVLRVKELGTNFNSSAWVLFTSSINVLEVTLK